MEIAITVVGGYVDGDWVASEIKAVDGDGQRYVITKDTDGTYCVDSELLGDDAPTAGGLPFAGGLSFEQAWLGLASAFGVVDEQGEGV